MRKSIRTIKTTKTVTITRDQLTAVQARADQFEAQIAKMRETEPARIDARVELVSHARRILGSDYNHTGKQDAQIMRDVVLKISPKLKDRLDAHKADAGYLRASYDAALELDASRVDSSGEVLRLTGEAIKDGSGSNLQQIYDQYIARMNRRAPATEGN